MTNSTSPKNIQMKKNDNLHSWTTNCAVQWALPLIFSALAVYNPVSSSLQCMISSLVVPFCVDTLTRSISFPGKGLLSLSQVTLTSLNSRREHSKTAFSPAGESNVSYGRVCTACLLFFFFFH